MSFRLGRYIIIIIRIIEKLTRKIALPVEQVGEVQQENPSPWSRSQQAGKKLVPRWQEIELDCLEHSNTYASKPLAGGDVEIPEPANKEILRTLPNHETMATKRISSENVGKDIYYIIILQCG